jgi:ATP-dependent RNA helicase RhlE
LPILQDLQENMNPNKRVIRSLILVPTRELAMQISKAISYYGRHLNVKHTEVFGGVSHKEQLRKINNGIDILIATPGRLLDHVSKKAIDLSSVQTLVLDEADTMLEMGFLEEIEALFATASTRRQILMFSATLNQNVKKLAKEFQKNPVVIQVHNPRSSVKLIHHEVYKVDEDKKAEMLSFLIGSKNYQQILVFVNTKKTSGSLNQTFQLRWTECRMYSWRYQTTCSCKGFN